MARPRNLYSLTGLSQSGTARPYLYVMKRLGGTRYRWCRDDRQHHRPHGQSERAHLVDLFLFKGRPINNHDRSVLVLVNEGFVLGFSPSRLSRCRIPRRPRIRPTPSLLRGQTSFPNMRIGPETFGKLDGIQCHVGHMVPNEVINRQFGRLVQMGTFFMSNMSPQRGSLNTGVWAQARERHSPDRGHPGQEPCLGYRRSHLRR